MKIGFSADQHLDYRYGDEADPETGRNLRTVDFERAFERVIDGMLAERVDVAIFGGDAFHRPKPGYAAIEWFIRQVKRLDSANIPVVGICGNHELSRMRMSSNVYDIVNAALGRPAFFAGYTPEIARFPRLGLAVHGVPHGALLDGNGGAGSFFPSPSFMNVLVVHGFPANLAVTGGAREAGEQRIDEGLLADRWDVILLGHWHEFRQVRKNAWYAGSTERCGYSDEAAVPGWALVALERGVEPVVEHRPIDARPMVSLPWIDGAGMDAAAIVEQAMQQSWPLYPGAIVRVRVRNAQPTRAKAVEVRLRELLPNPAMIRVQAAAVADRGARRVEWPVAAKAERPNIETLFGAYVAERGAELARHGPEFGAMFLERGRLALAQADEAARNAVVEG